MVSLWTVRTTGHRSSLDIIDSSSSPAFFSHANPRALQADGRNITNEQIDACAKRGGIICVNGVGRFLTDCAAGTSAILDCIDYLADRVGTAHVGLGIDYSYPENGLEELPPWADRNFWWPADEGYGPDGAAGVKIAKPEQIAEICEGLDKRGYKDEECRAILGRNMFEFASSVWKSA